jgi:broad specificity phosphatase PhoE
LTSDEGSPSPFRRANIKVYEEPRLREQDFGNFQPCSAEMERMWQERADYGHFFYRIPNGESAADAYDRVSGFNESLWRQFGEDDFPSVCVLGTYFTNQLNVLLTVHVLVTHGLMSRVFLMKWYHFTVEYFEDLRNINHCEFLIMRKQENNKYLLENKLRTWSDLRRERKDKEDKDKDSSKLPRTKTFVVTRRWGGCPNGCDHSRHYAKREDLEIMRKKDHENGGPEPYGKITSTDEIITIVSRKQKAQLACIGTNSESATPGAPDEDGPEIDISSNHEGKSVSDLNDTPSVISASEYIQSPYLHIGRDGGGSYSGHTSAAETDNDSSEDENISLHRIASLNAQLNRTVGERSGKPSYNQKPLLKAGPEHLAYTSDKDSPDEYARTNRLGDASTDASCDGDAELVEDLDRAEKEDRSIRGSVY